MIPPFVIFVMAIMFCLHCWLLYVMGASKWGAFLIILSIWVAAASTHIGLILLFGHKFSLP